MGKVNFMEALEQDLFPNGDESYQRLKKLEEELEKVKQDRYELFIRERDTKNDWREFKYENERLTQDLNHQLEVSNALRDVVKELEKENEALKEAFLKYQKLWTQMSYYFNNEITSFNDLDHKDFKALKRLAKGE